MLKSYFELQQHRTAYPILLMKIAIVRREGHDKRDCRSSLGALPFVYRVSICFSSMSVYICIALKTSSWEVYFVRSYIIRSIKRWPRRYSLFTASAEITC